MHIPYTKGPSPVPKANVKMVEGSEANKVSGVRVRGKPFWARRAFENASRTRSKLLPLRNFELIKTRVRPKISF